MTFPPFFLELKKIEEGVKTILGVGTFRNIDQFFFQPCQNLRAFKSIFRAQFRLKRKRKQE